MCVYLSEKEKLNFELFIIAIKIILTIHRKNDSYNDREDKTSRVLVAKLHVLLYKFKNKMIIPISQKPLTITDSYSC